MKITLDHNCLIHLERGGDLADCVRTTIADPTHECFVVNVGASEMRRFGVRPDDYGAFDYMLQRIGVADLPRLDPVGIWDVTFWNHCLFCGDADAELLTKIQSILFPLGTGNDNERRALNRLCDALTMWCHISYKNDVFLTTDTNFSKATRRRSLLEIGAGRICAPGDV